MNEINVVSVERSYGRDSVSESLIVAEEFMSWGSRIWQILVLKCNEISIEVNKINVMRVENMEDISIEVSEINVMRVENMEANR